MNTPPDLQSHDVHADLQHLQRRLALGLAQRTKICGKDALAWATVVIEVLQDEIGGDRLGSKGFYIPAANHRQKRDQKIRELMGPSPHSRRRVGQIAQQMNCSEATVWRAVAQVAK
jgi:hypothetical protein